MFNQEPEFEKGKWYYFKDDAAEAEFRRRGINNIVADVIIEGEGFSPVKISNGCVTNFDLVYGDNKDMVIYASERKFFTEMVEVECDEELDEVRDYDYDDSDKPSEPSDFPLTKITISNNSEAWTVYQMLKAHFKE
ncbi:putative RNA metabolism modulator [Escherichia phage C6]|nr:putative RNA metabolism modulator [Escherichia phage C6]